MKNIRGINPQNPIEIQVKFLSEVSGTISNVLDEIFGRSDNAWSILAQSAVTTLKNRDNLQVYVEDKDNEKHTIFFKVIKT